MDRHHRRHRAQERPDVVGRVEEVRPEAAQLERDREVLAQAVAGRAVHHRDEVLREVAQRRLVGRVAEEEVRGLVVEPREVADDVADVRPDPVVVPLACVDRDLHGSSGGKCHRNNNMRTVAEGGPAEAGAVGTRPGVSGAPGGPAPDPMSAGRSTGTRGCRGPLRRSFPVMAGRQPRCQASPRAGICQGKMPDARERPAAAHERIRHSIDQKRQLMRRTGNSSDRSARSSGSSCRAASCALTATPSSTPVTCGRHAASRAARTSERSRSTHR